MLKSKKNMLLAGLSLVLVVSLGWLTLKPNDDLGAPVSDSSESYLEAMRRLNSVQYRNIIRDLFGEVIQVDRDIVSVVKRVDGLLEAGASRAGMSAMGFEVAEEIAQSVAAQVIAESNRVELISCRPARENDFDQACAEQFITAVGRLLFRRPLTEEEQRQQLKLAAGAANRQSNFYAGLEHSLANMLVSPNFLYRVENTIEGRNGGYHLDAYSRASRLSFLLWNSTPDSALLLAAQQGDLYTHKGVQAQLERMLASPKLERGLRAFFSDMLAFDGFDTLIKDASLFPDFIRQVIDDTQEQSLRMMVDHLLTRDGDYRDLFTTRRTFLTPLLAAQLQIPLVQNLPNASPDRWQSYEFAEGDPRSGLLAQPGFVVLHSHPGRTSPTLRGKALREAVLCQEVPPPPPDVNFNLVQDSGNSEYRTMRDRLSAHATNPTCAGCHKITDPIGLALENFDGGGRYRSRENGEVIDASGEIDGIPFDDAVGLGQAVRDNPSAVSCLVNRMYAYGVGREMEAGDRKQLKTLRKDFANHGYKMVELLRLIGGSEEFYRGREPKVEAVAQR